MTDPEAIERFGALYAQHHGRVYAYAVSVDGHRVIIRVGPAGSGAVHREVQITSLTVSFSGIGQPQRITHRGTRSSNTAGAERVTPRYRHESGCR